LKMEISPKAARAIREPSIPLLRAGRPDETRRRQVSRIGRGGFGTAGGATFASRPEPYRADEGACKVRPAIDPSTSDRTLRRDSHGAFAVCLIDFASGLARSWK
jgi:hypothetical protein